MTCKTCKHWNIHKDKKTGECRRHAPLPIRISMLTSYGREPEQEISWPDTRSADFCGEHEGE